MDTQKGWRKCNRCQGFFNAFGVGGACIGGGMHDFFTSAEYKAPWGTPEPGAQEGWGACLKCACLAAKGAPGMCNDLTPHEFAEFGAHYSVLVGPHTSARPGWRWCNKCQCLWDGSHPTGQCYAGGAHDATGSLEYSVPLVEAALQRDWQWCNTCQGLVSAMQAGVCLNGAQHTSSSGTWYSVAFGDTATGSQPGWLLCAKCLTLVSESAEGTCFAGGMHEFAESLTYSVPFDVEPVDAQPGWRHCGKCQTLSYAGFEVGPCPAGDLHDHSAGSRYSVFPNSLAQGQPGWRLCRKCLALALGSVSDGVCRDGTAHDLTGSRAYLISGNGVMEGAENNWNWCHRCQCLAHGGPSFAGICHDGAPHDFTESESYGVQIESPPEGGEAGWRRCVVCNVLAFNGSGVPDGLCAGGASPHDFTGSPEFTVAVQALPEPPPPAGTSLTVAESADAVVVDGAGFGSETPVEVSFIVGGVTTEADLVTDGQGAFHHERRPVVPALPGGGLIIARDQAGAVASRRLKDFVPA